MNSEITNIRVYLGRFANETKLFDMSLEADIIPQKGDFIFYNDEVYKVLYNMLDVDNGEYSIFVRRAVEEDF
nr:MAG TPA: hypothetical protein [Herelleviridae sp.]